jgi:protein O-GlcNAcase / histone acetyltransferase
VDFFSGVIEGFYGAPWSAAERVELFEWMARWRLNTYMYAPKDDLKHRAVWRESYSGEEADRFKELIHACGTRGIRFVYALSPGLDIRYDDPAELQVLQGRVDQMMTLGCRDFALLFDDIPDRLDAAVIARFGSLAAAQCDLTNTLVRWIVEKEPRARVAFCPTPYCSRMVDAGLGGEGYLQTVGRELMPSIGVFWTGPDIVSREITTDHVREIAAILRRPPIIWDNLFANDYDGHRFFCGPYAGRARELRTETSGLLLNPNNELLLNYVPLHTFSAFVHGDEDAGGGYDPRAAYLAGMREWAAWFETINGPIPLDDVMLLGDCYYLPYEDGPEADALYQQARHVISGLVDRGRPGEWEQAAARFRERAGHLRQLCVRLAELRRRPLFHALSRRVWDLKEELDLLDRYAGASGHPTFTSDYHRPGTYRGGLVAKLQRLLVPQPDATFTPSQTTTSIS